MIYFNSLFSINSLNTIQQLSELSPIYYTPYDVWRIVF